MSAAPATPGNGTTTTNNNEPPTVDSFPLDALKKEDVDKYGDAKKILQAKAGPQFQAKLDALEQLKAEADAAWKKSGNSKKKRIQKQKKRTQKEEAAIEAAIEAEDAALEEEDAIIEEENDTLVAEELQRKLEKESLKLLGVVFPVLKAQKTCHESSISMVVTLNVGYQNIRKGFKQYAEYCRALKAGFRKVRDDDEKGSVQEKKALIAALEKQTRELKASVEADEKKPKPQTPAFKGVSDDSDDDDDDNNSSSIPIQLKNILNNNNSDDDSDSQSGSQSDNGGDDDDDDDDDGANDDDDDGNNNGSTP